MRAVGHRGRRAIAPGLATKKRVLIAPVIARSATAKYPICEKFRTASRASEISEWRRIQASGASPPTHNPPAAKIPAGSNGSSALRIRDGRPPKTGKRRGGGCREVLLDNKSVI